MNNKMMKKTENIYDVNVYSDTELYNMLDLINPSDRELEAKILFLFNKYKNMQTPSGNDLAKFFSDIYDRFFEPPNEEPELVNEFFENQEEDDDEEDVSEGYENVFEGMENMNMNVLFIDSCVYFGIDNDMFEKIEKPLLYSNDQFVANTLFDIYDHFQNL
jgi:hypothetical protein